MSIFHSIAGHKGPETGRRFIPGMMETGGKFKGGLIDAEMIYGYTEISYKCEICGAPFTTRVVGKVIDENRR